jgi:isopentenyl phosphate kinase
MNEILFLKLGGSLITDKTRPQALRDDVLARLAREIAAACAAQPEMRLLLGHGSGSFGHVTAKRYGTRDGVRTTEEWRGFAETGRVAGELNRLVVEALAEAGAPALRIQPSASAVCRDGELRYLAERPIVEAVAHGLLPVIHGDVAFDETRGGTIISTEEIFAYLARRLGPARIILAGEVDGVLTADPASGITGEVTPLITPANLSEVESALGGSRGVDVTGGMMAKVREMIALAQGVESLREIHILSGLKPGLVRDALLREDVAVGTRIRSDETH